MKIEMGGLIELFIFLDENVLQETVKYKVQNFT